MSHFDRYEDSDAEAAAAVSAPSDEDDSDEDEEGLDEEEVQGMRRDAINCKNSSLHSLDSYKHTNEYLYRNSTAI